MTNSTKIKKVLFLTPFPPPYGGIATLTKILFEKGLPTPYSASVVDTKSLGSSVLKEAQREIMIVLKLFWQLIFKRPNVVHLNCSVSPVGVHRDLICIFMSRIMGVPTLSHYHGNIGDFNVHGKYLFSNFSLKYLMKCNSLNIFSNIPSLNLAITRFSLDRNPERNYIIPNYASDKVWKYEHAVVDKKPLTCVFVGNLSKAKGTDLIVELAKDMPHFQFDLIGRIGKDVEDLLNNHRPQNVKLCGLMDQIEVYQYLESADVFLFPSLTEGFPLSIVEAMSIGLPVLCTDVGSLPEQIDEGQGGFIVKASDKQAFKQSLDKLSNYELRKSMGFHNRAKARREYNFDSVAKRLVESYNKIS